MKVLLKIGYCTFILPNDSGVQAVVKTLSKALNANDYSFRRDGYVEVDEEPLEVSVKYLTGKTPIRSRRDRADEPPELLALEAPTSIIIPPA